jgi:hypothetical protein
MQQKLGVYLLLLWYSLNGAAVATSVIMSDAEQS